MYVFNRSKILKKNTLIGLITLEMIVVGFLAKADQSGMLHGGALSAQFDLPATAKALERKHSAIVTEIEAEGKKGHSHWEIELFDADRNRKIEIQLDWKTGEVQKTRMKQFNNWLFRSKKQLACEKVREMGFGVLDAVTLVSEAAVGTFKEAELEYQENIAFVIVKFDVGTVKQKWIVDIEKQTLIPILKR